MLQCVHPACYLVGLLRYVHVAESVWGSTCVYTCVLHNEHLFSCFWWCVCYSVQMWWSVCVSVSVCLCISVLWVMCVLQGLCLFQCFCGSGSVWGVCVCCKVYVYLKITVGLVKCVCIAGCVSLILCALCVRWYVWFCVSVVIEDCTILWILTSCFGCSCMPCVNHRRCVCLGVFVSPVIPLFVVGRCNACEFTLQSMCLSWCSCGCGVTK